MKRTLSVLALPGVLGLRCVPTSACVAPRLGLGTGGVLSSACPSSLFLDSVSHSAGVQVLELSAPSRPCCQLQVMSSAQQMLHALRVINPVSPGGSLSG